MMRIGIISDTHIPSRAAEIPKEFLEWFKENRVDLILHAGDVNDEIVLKDLEKIAEVKAVKGNTDYLDLPKELILEIKGKRILLFHSDNIYPRGDINKMLDYAKEKMVDIVVYGHTHLPLFTYVNGIYFLNPGSATGVRSGEIKRSVKSVAILYLENKIKVEFNILD